jgi:hypothetical protein
MSRKASKNFYYYEYAPKGKDSKWMPETANLERMVATLAMNMQIVRDHMPSGSSISITSAIRSPEDTKRLIAAGYNPSATSDHNYGNPVPIKAGTDKAKKYGLVYAYSVGAADCVPGGGKISTLDMFKLCVSLNVEGKTSFGQVIYEKNPKGSDWVHLGNDPSVILSDVMESFIGRQKYLQSFDNGKTYSIYLV